MLCLAAVAKMCRYLSREGYISERLSHGRTIVIILKQVGGNARFNHASTLASKLSISELFKQVGRKTKEAMTEKHLQTVV